MDCEHAPDLTSLEPVPGSPGQADARCRKCGARGSGWIEIHDIDWAEELDEDD